jgi:hypothetical protein
MICSRIWFGGWLGTAVNESAAFPIPQSRILCLFFLACFFLLFLGYVSSRNIWFVGFPSFQRPILSFELKLLLLVLDVCFQYLELRLFPGKGFTH